MMFFSNLKKIKLRLKYWRNFLLDFIFPKKCQICGQEGSWLCDSCQKKLKFNYQQHCFGCHAINHSGKFCSKCKNNFYLNGIISCLNYREQNIDKIIKKFKYYFIKELAKNLGQIIFSFLKSNQKEFLNKILKAKNENKLLIIPVPLSLKRQRWRNFNQAEEIAKNLASFLELPINTELKRIKHTIPQVKLKATQRKENIKNCFLWLGQKINNKIIILIDDVATTGATLNECAKELKKNQAQEIWGLVIANNFKN